MATINYLPFFYPMANITSTQADLTGPYSYPNLTTKELDRDIVNLLLPEIDLLAQPGELERLYPPGFWDDLLAPDA